MEDFERFRKQRTIVMTTFKRDGTPVPSPVSIAVDEKAATSYVRTWSTSGKAKRLRRDPHVIIAPSTFRGQVTGPETHAHARLLTGAEDDRASRLLQHKHRVLHGVLVPLVHKLRHYTTQHYELQVE